MKQSEVFNDYFQHNNTARVLCTLLAPGKERLTGIAASKGIYYPNRDRETKEWTKRRFWNGSQ